MSIARWQTIKCTRRRFCVDRQSGFVNFKILDNYMYKTLEKHTSQMVCSAKTSIMISHKPFVY